VLALQDNAINSRGAAALAEPATLSRWRQMQRLDLRGNSISKECAEILHMAATRMWGRPETILV
jgi:Ran GTPase-activating protein (RanGAP) involved in mRNA processing and transport